LYIKYLTLYLIKSGLDLLKRTFDILLILISALLFLPVFILVALIVRSKLGSPIFFKQSRIGLNGRIFGILKFRTMTNEFDKNGVLKPDNVRLTKFGKFIRSTSLDELPGLWNVLKGDMSLVGPRPFIVEYLPLYSEEQSRRHEIKPGITGWAQVNGRNAISWDKKFDLDIWYVDNQSIWLDIKILFLTMKKVIARKDIDENIHTTMEKFKGSADTVNDNIERFSDWKYPDIPDNVVDFGESAKVDHKLTNDK